MTRTIDTRANVWHDVNLLSDDDLYLFNEGSHFRLYDKLGAHPQTVDGQAGTGFAVWAPNAERVCVMGDFNGWNRTSHPLRATKDSGIWTGFIPGVGHGDSYKYRIRSHSAGYEVDKADPLALASEVPPRTASRVWDMEYAWSDHDWMADRRRRNSLASPISIYEMHVGSWRRHVEEDRPLTYRELAEPLAEHCQRLNFTHVEFLPIMEHPFHGSWGYQVTGYFAPTARYGTPQDFMYLIDYLHQRRIGVILDWVPSHFPTDEHGLIFFDGTHLYEHADPRQGMHKDWNTAIFNYDRNEVRSFLASSGLFWLDKYHIDGLRVDAVASMLYLDYSRKEGEWIPNQYGGRENLGAISFLRRFNEEVFRAFPDTQTIAEESTAWPMVSRPTYLGGLGFGLKWDMGWMHDTLHYFERDPIHRRYHHNQLTFRMLYAFNENFCMSLSHDEVVYGKGSLIGKMPGDIWQKQANLRLLFGYMIAQPGKKLVFMGGEFGQWNEWNHDASLDWHLLQFPGHLGVQRCLEDLNKLYRNEPALHELDCDPAGFQWLDANDADSSVLSFLRLAKNGDVILVICNFTPLPRHNYRVGVPWPGFWREVMNTDAKEYGGSGHGNWGGHDSTPVRLHGRPHMINAVLPPLSVVFFKWQRE
ncbi:MAG: 1,4-alpha-glucan branching protein GlgB [Gemmataceae bacterium]